MKYGLITIKYLKKHFLKLLPFVLLPALALAFTNNIASFVRFFFNFDANANNVWTIYSFFTVVGAKSWSMGIMAILVLMFFECLLFGGIDRHLKVGKFSYGKSFSALNETVMIVVPCLLILVVAFELVAFLTAVIIYFFQIVMPAIAIFGGIIFTIAIYTGLMMLLIQFLMVIPAVLVVGYPIKDACVFSTKMVSGKTKETMLLVLILMGASIILSAVASLFASAFILFVVDALIYIFLMMFVTVYIMVTFFDLSGETRRDLIGKNKKYLT